MQVQTVPERLLNLEASQDEQVVESLQVRQVDEQVEQFADPLSKNPVIHEQFWLMSLLVGSLQVVQVAVGELHAAHAYGQTVQVVPLT